MSEIRRTRTAVQQTGRNRPAYPGRNLPFVRPPGEQDPAPTPRVAAGRSDARYATRTARCAAATVPNPGLIRVPRLRRRVRVVLATVANRPKADKKEQAAYRSHDSWIRRVRPRPPLYFYFGVSTLPRATRNCPGRPVAHGDSLSSGFSTNHENRFNLSRHRSERRRATAGATSVLSNLWRYKKHRLILQGVFLKHLERKKKPSPGHSTAGKAPDCEK